MSAEGAREGHGRWPGLPPWAPLSLLGLAGVVLVVHSLVYNFVTDDAYISFVFSRNFAEHGELAFNLGDPVEGYTNFSWTVLLGALMKVGIPPEISSRVFGTAAALGTLVVVFRTMQRAMPERKDSPWVALPSLVLALSSGFACWSSGGLETQLFTFLVVAAVDAVVASVTDPRAIRRAGWLLALAAMTRPEGPLVAAMLGVARMTYIVVAAVRISAGGPKPWLGRFPLRDELLAAAWFLGLWVPWFAWRWWYYGYPFPNTYYVKAAGNWSNPKLAAEMVDNGFYYIWVWLKQTGALYAAPAIVAGLVLAWPRTPRFVLGLASLLIAMFYIPYAISVGGDFMGLHRFIMPLFVVAAIGLVLGLERLASLHQLAGAIVAALVVLGFAYSQIQLTRESVRNTKPDRGIDTPAFLIVYTEDRAKIGAAMASCFTPDDFSIVGGAGAQPYLGRMRGIDVFGLVSDKIAHREPRIRARAGHTKWGSDRTLAEYAPNFMFACYDIRETPELPVLPCAGYWRSQGFEPVTIRVPGMKERGEYYTFLAKKSRNFQCPNRVH